jgi:hypothetical protein
VRGLPSVRIRSMAASLSVPPHSIAKDHHAPSLCDGVIGDRKSLLLAQPFFQTSNDLPGTLKCEAATFCRLGQGTT